MKVPQSFEMLGTFTQLHISENLTIKQQQCENLKSCRTCLTYVLYTNQFPIRVTYVARQPLEIVKLCYTRIFNFYCAEMFLHILKKHFLPLCIHQITIYISMNINSHLSPYIASILKMEYVECSSGVWNMLSWHHRS